MYMFGNLTIEIAPRNIIWPIVISGFSVTCIFVPMTTFSMATVSRENMGEANGLTNLAAEPWGKRRDLGNHYNGGTRRANASSAYGGSDEPVQSGVQRTDRQSCKRRLHRKSVQRPLMISHMD